MPAPFLCSFTRGLCGASSGFAASGLSVGQYEIICKLGSIWGDFSGPSAALVGLYQIHCKLGVILAVLDLILD